MRAVTTFLFVLGGVSFAFAQLDSVQVLDEVILTDVKLRRFSSGVKTRVLSDSILQRNTGMLTDNLRFNSNIYFRENGYGMVSSPSFRGTGAQQTAVVWNGININSQLTGQTDFNTIIGQANNELTVRSGGGSVQYGTGSIGGSIHLNSLLPFQQELEQQLTIGYGSFDTRLGRYALSSGNDKTAFQVNLGYFGSQNDYPYLGTDQRNENGAFSHYNLDFSVGTLVSPSDILKVYHNTFLGDRDFSGTLTAPSDDNYEDVNSRSLLEWVRFHAGSTQRVKLAYLFERYRYYANKENDAFSFGRSGSWFANYDYKYEWNRLALNGVVEAQVIEAEGSAITSENRNLLSAILLFSHRPTAKLSWGLNLRQDWVNDYESPFVFATDAAYQVADLYRFTFNGSKNYRIPTFNDLYWQGAGAIGNSTIVPETSWQMEVGQHFQLTNIQLGLNAYYIASDNLIQWRPDVAGIWSPVNIREALQYGAEVEAQFEKKIGAHTWKGTAAYTFTKSIDKETTHQLIYVPVNRIQAACSYAYKRWGAFLQTLYNGSVFTTTDNSQTIEGYLLTNLGIDYQWVDLLGVSTTMRMTIDNILNENYQNVAFRPMPNRNIHLQLHLKF